jgi:hypothetical protein
MRKDLFNQDEGEEEDKVVEAGKGAVAVEEDAHHLQTMCKHWDVGEEAMDSRDVEAIKERSQEGYSRQDASIPRMCTRYTTIGTYVSCAVLMSRTDTHHRRGQRIGAR